MIQPIVIDVRGPLVLVLQGFHILGKHHTREQALEYLHLYQDGWHQ